MMRRISFIFLAAVGFAGTALAEPASVPFAEPHSVQAVDAAMARIEARVMDFAGTSGVVATFLAPYEPIPLPDPTQLIEFNSALAAYWTGSMATAVDDFVTSHIALFDEMSIQSSVDSWAPFVPFQAAVTPTAAQSAETYGTPTNLTDSEMLGEAAPESGFDGETKFHAGAVGAGFFGGN